MFELDKDIEIDRYSKICTFCKHFKAKGRGLTYPRKCKAFDEIPLEIWNGDNNHIEAYPDDNGIRFEAIEF